MPPHQCESTYVTQCHPTQPPCESTPWPNATPPKPIYLQDSVPPFQAGIYFFHDSMPPSHVRSIYVHDAMLPLLGQPLAPQLNANIQDQSLLPWFSATPIQVSLYIHDSMPPRVVSHYCRDSVPPRLVYFHGLMPSLPCQYLPPKFSVVTPRSVSTSMTQCHPW